jgi:hypothetical protein
MQQKDPFTGRPTHLTGSRLPGAEGWTAVLDGHWQRLRALDQLVKAARECGIGTDKDLDIVRLAEDEVSLLETGGGEWAALGDAIREFRRHLPVIAFEAFGFSSDVEDPFEVDSARLRRIGGGVEALAFVDAQHSVYKFFLFREGGDVGATFAFRPGESDLLEATAVPGSYRRLLEKLSLTHQFGIPTEITGITPEGILVAKQTFGRLLPEKTDMSGLAPDKLIPIPSRFLRADRDHPRLAFLDEVPWLVADTHDRNVVVDETGAWRIIDLVAAPLPVEWLEHLALFRDWIERARHDPHAEIFAPANDDEL